MRSRPVLTRVNIKLCMVLDKKQPLFLRRAVTAIKKQEATAQKKKQ